MIEVIGVKFKSGGKMYDFAAGAFNPAEGSFVVVETARGEACAEVAARRRAVPDESLPQPVRAVVRMADEEDMRRYEARREWFANALQICQARIDRRGLPMQLVDVESGPDSSKLIFYFSAEHRVDFRELVKELSNTFHMRIELRQVGERDRAKLFGGIGICGREYCCKGFLDAFQQISIKMAKSQGLAMNPAKISGACGRLMCCLQYEQPVYEELVKETPRVGSTVLLPGEPPIRAYVMEANLITGKLRVKPENADLPITVAREDVERLTDASRRMTKEDLRRGENPVRTGARPQRTQNPQNAQHTKNTPAGEAEEGRHAPKKPRPQKQKSAARQEKPQNAAQPKQAAQSQRPAAQQKGGLHAEFGESRQPKQTQAEKQSQPRPAAQQKSGLHTEFGESRQPKQAHPERPAPPRRASQPIDTDFTERRASHGQPGEPK